MSINLGFAEIRLYAIMILLGILAGYWIAMKRRDRFNILKDDIENLIILGIPISILSARTYHILTELDYYSSNPSQIIKLQFDGLAYFGAFIGMIALGYIYSRLKKINLIELVDLISPSLLVAQAIGRIGNFFNHEIYGFPTNFPWGIHIPEALRVTGYEMHERFHPTFAYEALLNLLGFGMILFIENKLKLNKKYISGLNFSLYLIWYGIVRLVIGFIRIEPDDWWILNDGQMFALGFITAGVGILGYIMQKQKA